MISTSQREAQLLVKEAEIHADKIVNQAMERAQEMDNRIQELRTRRRELQLKLRGTLELYAQIVEADVEDEHASANVQTFGSARADDLRAVRRLRCARLGSAGLLNTRGTSPTAWATSPTRSCAAGRSPGCSRTATAPTSPGSRARSGARHSPPGSRATARGGCRAARAPSPRRRSASRSAAGDPRAEAVWPLA